MTKTVLVGLITILALSNFGCVSKVINCEKGDCHNGPGLLTTTDGTKMDGTFKDGKFAEGTFTSPDGTNYQFKNGAIVHK